MDVPRSTLIAIGALACVAAGAAAGLDAGRNVSAFYTTTPTPRWQPATVTPAPTTGSEWATSATYPATPYGVASREDEAGRDERAFFDTGVHEEWRDEAPPPVRIHRAVRVEETAPVLEPPRDDAADAGDGAEDGWVDAPAVAGPERLPSG